MSVILAVSTALSTSLTISIVLPSLAVAPAVLLAVSPLASMPAVVTLPMLISLAVVPRAGLVTLAVSSVMPCMGAMMRPGSVEVSATVTGSCVMATVAAFRMVPMRLPVMGCAEDECRGADYDACCEQAGRPVAAAGRVVIGLCGDREGKNQGDAEQDRRDTAVAPPGSMIRVRGSASLVFHVVASSEREAAPCERPLLGLVFRTALLAIDSTRGRFPRRGGQKARSAGLCGVRRAVQMDYRVEASPRAPGTISFGTPG